MTGGGLRRLFDVCGSGGYSEVTIACLSELTPPLPQRVLLRDFLSGLDLQAYVFTVSDGYVLALCTG